MSAQMAGPNIAQQLPQNQQGGRQQQSQAGMKERWQALMMVSRF